ncbi:type I 3-dehydroquinate dehydratase [Paenibacillus sp. P96]|uniref:3-dehydroquinate dehydratase n=1 Tax=Paenibacillus zeirhizosphaerae TaxID=2987519 RepID=A0ABT9FMA0_9BACL|nr:type I 3-dehydroquinate dehydratase [Paenibacillus sp. P96]MDP4095868.1 type I 3-dehydroquinate dehydratase [Paenibacillus sp. P96]
MYKTVQVKDIIIGEGAPKICVPITGETLPRLIAEAEQVRTLDLDLVEWRVDFYEHADDIEMVKKTLGELRAALGDMPLLFTFRTSEEGGQREIMPADYVALNQAVAATGQVDLIDVEWFNKEQHVRELAEAAQAAGVRVILSNHDFDKTPPAEEIVSRLCRAQELGGDIVKIAVMPNSMADVLILLEATNRMKEQYADRPLITMSMTGRGVVSRLAGELFGSALTFGSAGRSSAPGQVPVGELRGILSLLHSELTKG